MLKIDIICVGKLKEKFFEQACAEYLKRISGYANITIKELPESKNGASIDANIRKDTSSIEEVIPKNALVIVLSPEGKQVSTEEFSDLFIRSSINGQSHICFIIGGSNGLADDFKKKSEHLISFSRMTFPHHLFRVMLLEQIYRSFMDYSGKKYSK